MVVDGNDRQPQAQIGFTTTACWAIGCSSAGIPSMCTWWCDGGYCNHFDGPYSTVSAAIAMAGVNRFRSRAATSRARRGPLMTFQLLLKFDGLHGAAAEMKLRGNFISNRDRLGIDLIATEDFSCSITIRRNAPLQSAAPGKQPAVPGQNNKVEAGVALLSTRGN